jgi:hypothetical protein
MAPAESQEHLPLWMEYAKVFFTPILSLIAALVGLYIASKLTEMRDAKKEKVRIEKESIYIAILLTAHLDKVVTSCIHVAFDDGTCEGHPAGEDGQRYQTKTSTPKFDPLEIESDWRVLPTKLMQGILELPHTIERLNEKLSAIGEYESPYEYGEYFQTRQYDYAQLGIETGNLMSDLREHAGIPMSLDYERWSRNGLFVEKIKQIAELRRQHAAQLSHREKVTSIAEQGLT